jgi:hypothetical protein
MMVPDTGALSFKKTVTMVESAIAKDIGVSVMDRGNKSRGGGGSIGEESSLVGSGGGDPGGFLPHISVAVQNLRLVQRAWERKMMGKGPVHLG